MKFDLPRTTNNNVFLLTPTLRLNYRLAKVVEITVNCQRDVFSLVI